MCGIIDISGIAINMTLLTISVINCYDCSYSYPHMLIIPQCQQYYNS